MNEEKMKTLDELIRSFDTGYYRDKIEIAEKQIYNLEIGFSQGSKAKMPVLSQKEVKKEVDILKKYKKKLESKSLELGHALSDLDNDALKLKELSEKNSLMQALEIILFDRGKDIDSSIAMEYKNEYLKYRNKSGRPIDEQRFKINKAMRKKIKTLLYEMAYRQAFGYDTIEHAFKNNNKNLETIGLILFQEYSKDCQKLLHSKDRVSFFDADVGEIRYAIEALEEKLDSRFMIMQAKPVFENYKSLKKMQELNVHELSASINSSYSKLLSQFELTLRMAKETWYLKKIIVAFKDTAINSEAVYKGLISISEKIEQKTLKEIKKCIELYEKSGIKDKIELMQQLDELNNKCEFIVSEVNHMSQNRGDKEAELLKSKYFEIRAQMIKILRDNPELNKQSYNINIKDYEKPNSFMNETVLEEQKNLNKEANKTNNSDNGSIKSPAKNMDEKTKVEKPNIELEPGLQSQRTAYYSNYMREKVLESNLGKLPFSEYLKEVAPRAKQLISIEKEREAFARNIYREYIIYYSSLEDKKQAISFEKFAYKTFNTDKIDIPVEKEEEYKGLRR